MNHMRSLFTLSLLIVSLCYAMTCSSQKDKTEVTEQGTTAGQEIASVVSPTNADLDKSQNWNELAKLLAGVEGPKSDSPAVNRHRALMKDFWVRIQKENMEPIAAWREKNLPESAKSRNVLYPLSGADFLNAYAFFPGASDYILIALEPPGSAPHLEKMTEAQRESGLASARKAIWTLAQNNYLQSRIMHDEFNNPNVTGTLPAFLIMLGGLGHEVKNVQDIGIGKTGQLAAAADAPRTKGVLIQFKDSKDGKNKRLIYLSMRLEKQTAESTSPEGIFLRGIGRRNTMMKSAVYILGWESMKLPHDVILGQSDLVIQDDSGIPYKSFQDGKWNEKLYGTYVRALPVGGIPNPPQQGDLAAAYAKGASPLPFAYGYGILRGKGQSNLMLFTRR